MAKLSVGLPTVTDMELFESNPELRPIVVDGFIREGETANIIASPKFGKSWLVAQLAYSVASGRPWLGLQTTQGKVLIVDNELHAETLASRMKTVRDAMDAEAGNVHIAAMRGRAKTITELWHLFRSMDWKSLEFRLIIIDAFYRAIPSGVNENDNAAMMSIYNTLDEIGSFTKAAIAVVHHASKGSQAGKENTDIGAGAGSISRAADTHLTLVRHEIADCAVMNISTRSFISPEPKTLRWEYPLWHDANIEPEVKGTKSTKDANQQKQDRETDDRIRAEITGKKRSKPELRSATGWGDARIQRSLDRLKALSRSSRNKKTGKVAIRYWLQEPDNFSFPS